MNDTPIVEHLTFLAVFIPAAFVVGILAWKAGFFRLSSKNQQGWPRLSFWDLFGAFFVYFVVHFFVVPAVGMGVIFGMTAQWPTPETIDTQMQGWLNIAAMVTSLVAVVGYLLWLSGDKKQILCDKSRAGLLRRGHDVLVGVSGLFVSYPFVMVTTHLMGIVVFVTLAPAKEEQVAVRYFRTTLEYPLLLWAMMAAIVAVVPVVEELLFRGFLQTWLRRHVGKYKAIIITALVFSAFHFSPTQHASNVELLSSLFVFSCFLGFLYERQRSLLAPIALHVAFNAINVGIILFS